MKKRTIAKILLFTLVLCIGVLPYIPAVADSEVLATVLFTNDSKGFTEDLGFIQRYKEETPHAMLVECGNFSKGSIEASLSNAKYSSLLMNAAEYDLVSLGTDDFAYGFRALKRFGDYTGCEMLSGNIHYSSAEVYAQNSVRNVNGVKIGFFSLVDGACADYITSARREGYIFEEEIEFARSQVAQLKEKCDKIVCLASFADNNDALSPEILAEKAPGIDCMICSNLHTQVDKTAGSTRIIAAGECLKSLGKIEFLSNNSLRTSVLPREKKDSTGKVMEDTAGTYREYGDSPIYNTTREEYIEEFEKTLDSHVAKNKTTIFGVDDKEKISLLEETPLGDLFADAITLAGDKYKAINTQYKDYYIVGMINGTALTNNIVAGDIYIKDVFQARGIAEDVYFYECNANFLYYMIEKSVKEIRYNQKTDFVYHPSEYFLQISGFNVVINPLNKAGSKIIKMFIKDGDDEILVRKNDTKKFLIGVNESFAKGFAKYDEFTRLKPVYVGDFLTNYVRTAIASNVSEEYYISPGTDSRIAFKRIEELQPNGDAWATIDKDYEDYAAAEVYVDGVDNMDCSQVDENGEVRITLKTGAHGVSVNGEDTYVSTVSGFGLKKNSITPIVDYKLYYKTLDDAYKIDEEKYEQEAVNGYFEYLGRAYVETKLTEEGEVVKATQDIYTLWDDFLENPNSFIKQEDEEEEEEDEESARYPSLEDFAYRGEFESNVFDNTPNTTYTSALKSEKAQTVQRSDTTRTGDTVAVVLVVFSAAALICAASIGVYLIKKKKEGR